MSNQIKNIAVEVLESTSLAHEEIIKLESSIDLLVRVTNSLNVELETAKGQHYVRCANAIRSNVETIHRLTVSVHNFKLTERKHREKDVTSSGWEVL